MCGKSWPGTGNLTPPEKLVAPRRTGKWPQVQTRAWLGLRWMHLPAGLAACSIPVSPVTGDRWWQSAVHRHHPLPDQTGQCNRRKKHAVSSSCLFLFIRGPKRTHSKQVFVSWGHSQHDHWHHLRSPRTTRSGPKLRDQEINVLVQCQTYPP